MKFIDELKKLEAEATPAPWKIGVNRPHLVFPNAKNEYALAKCEHFMNDGYYPGEDNAAFIVAARNATPKLIAAIEVMEEKLNTIAKICCEDNLKCDGHEPGFTRVSGFRWTCKVCTPVKYALAEVRKLLGEDA